MSYVVAHKSLSSDAAWQALVLRRASACAAARLRVLQRQQPRDEAARSSRASDASEPSPALDAAAEASLTDRHEMHHLAAFLGSVRELQASMSIASLLPPMAAEAPFALQRASAVRAGGAETAFFLEHGFVACRSLAPRSILTMMCWPRCRALNKSALDDAVRVAVLGGRVSKLSANLVRWLAAASAMRTGRCAARMRPGARDRGFVLTVRFGADSEHAAIAGAMGRSSLAIVLRSAAEQAYAALLRGREERAGAGALMSWCARLA